MEKQTISFLKSKTLPFFIDGKEIITNNLRAVVNPASCEDITQISLSTTDHVDDAIKAAQKAFKSWGNLPALRRNAYIHRLAELMERDKQILAELETIDVGKLLSAAQGFDVPFAVDAFKYFAELAEKEEYVIDLQLQVTRAYMLKKPYGVCGFIFPWNFPLTLCAWGIAPALAAGNTVVFKPATDTPLSSIYLCRLIKEAGFPDGVVNMVIGDGNDVGEALISDPRLKHMSFTGSTSVGKRIGEACGKNLIPVKLELGGKGAAVVCRDADIDTAVEGLCGAITLNTGQVCCTATRWYLHDDIYDLFMQKAIALLNATKLGSGFDDDSEMGPICTAKQLKSILVDIKTAQQHGASIACGGKRNEQGTLKNGYFMEPTLLTGSDDNPMAQEEIFGPVAFVLRFNDEDEVTCRVNQNDYGLANSVWSKDYDRAYHMASRLVAGNCWINAHNIFEYGLPYGACNKSGCGGGVNSVDTFHDYLRHQSIASIK